MCYIPGLLFQLKQFFFETRSLSKLFILIVSLGFSCLSFLSIQCYRPMQLGLAPSPQSFGFFYLLSISLFSFSCLYLILLYAYFIFKFYLNISKCICYLYCFNILSCSDGCSLFKIHLMFSLLHSLYSLETSQMHSCQRSTLWPANSLAWLLLSFAEKLKKP